MLINKFQSRKYREKDSEGGEGGGGKTPTIEELQAEREALLKKNEELLTEAKRAKNAKREAEEQARLQAEEKAKASNDFKQLFESSEAERKKAAQELTELREKVANEKRHNEAMKLATELADGTNAELLAEFVTKRLKYSDDKIQVTNDKGELTVSTLADLKKEFQNDARYKSLLKGNQSSGGGANGGDNSGGAAKSITRQEFEALNPAERQKFTKAGGVVV